MVILVGLPCFLFMVTLNAVFYALFDELSLF